MNEIAHNQVILVTFHLLSVTSLALFLICYIKSIIHDNLGWTSPTQITEILLPCKIFFPVLTHVLRHQGFWKYSSLILNFNQGKSQSQPSFQLASYVSYATHVLTLFLPAMAGLNQPIYTYHVTHASRNKVKLSELLEIFFTGFQILTTTNFSRSRLFSSRAMCHMQHTF